MTPTKQTEPTSALLYALQNAVGKLSLHVPDRIGEPPSVSGEQWRELADPIRAAAAALDGCVLPEEERAAVDAVTRFAERPTPRTAEFGMAFWYIVTYAKSLLDDEQRQRRQQSKPSRPTDETLESWPDHEAAYRALGPRPSKENAYKFMKKMREGAPFLRNFFLNGVYRYDPAGLHTLVQVLKIDKEHFGTKFANAKRALKSNAGTEMSVKESAKAEQFSMELGELENRKLAAKKAQQKVNLGRTLD
jgi:hypothetical protein